MFFREPVSEMNGGNNEIKGVSVMRKMTVFLAGLVFAVLFASCGDSGEMDARIVSVFRVDGDTVSLSNRAGVMTDARDGMSLHEGV